MGRIEKIIRRVYKKIGSRTGFLVSDEKYIKNEWKLNMDYPLDLASPKTFNEKLQWLKLHDRKDIYTTMVDKFQAKKYVADIIGEEYIIPTLGVYDRFDDINFDNLPNKFVIKCTHDSGGLVICRDKTKLDIFSTKKIIERNLKRNYYYCGREWPYKNVKPRIIVERYLEDVSSKTMRDYKFFCFNGEPKIMYLSEGLEDHRTARMSFYDMNMDLVDCRRSDYKPLGYKPKQPINFKKMKKFSAMLSEDIPHVRVDWYEVNGKLYFGELTFTTRSGFIPFSNKEWDDRLGDMIELPKLEGRS
ncbi:glycosyl transferase [Candidatus Saccharibacteria bacterium]|nr:glycosyl transferase [Candidatus Saccharibacteria bacterium]